MQHLQQQMSTMQQQGHWGPPPHAGPMGPQGQMRPHGPPVSQPGNFQPPGPPPPTSTPGDTQQPPQPVSFVHLSTFYRSMTMLKSASSCSRPPPLREECHHRQMMPPPTGPAPPHKISTILVTITRNISGRLRYLYLKYTLYCKNFFSCC